MIIPSFSNVELKYELLGDFVNLKRISINNISKNNAYDWYCIFEFKEKPVDGYMVIRYV